MHALLEGIGASAAAIGEPSLFLIENFRVSFRPNGAVCEPLLNETHDAETGGVDDRKASDQISSTIRSQIAP
jgi:hypothetical protein